MEQTSSNRAITTLKGDLEQVKEELKNLRDNIEYQKREMEKFNAKELRHLRNIEQLLIAINKLEE